MAEREQQGGMGRELEQDQETDIGQGGGLGGTDYGGGEGGAGDMGRGGTGGGTGTDYGGGQEGDLGGGQTDWNREGEQKR